jgi:hypothetical protein
VAAKQRTRKKPHNRVLKFPKVKGKVVAEVELSISPDFNVIEVIFDDKTAISFEIVPCFKVVPEMVNWKNGTYRPTKRWQAVHSM